MGLKSLDDSNEEAFERQLIGAPVKNGIACPRCGAELYDTNPDRTLTTYPPQRNTNCGSCPYTGTRYL